MILKSTLHFALLLLVHTKVNWHKLEEQAHKTEKTNSLIHSRPITDLNHLIQYLQKYITSRIVVTLASTKFWLATTLILLCRFFVLLLDDPRRSNDNFSCHLKSGNCNNNEMPVYLLGKTIFLHMYNIL